MPDASFPSCRKAEGLSGIHYPDRAHLARRDVNESRTAPEGASGMTEGR